MKIHRFRRGKMIYNFRMISWKICQCALVASQEKERVRAKIASAVLVQQQLLRYAWWLHKGRSGSIIIPLMGF